jgi:hypothetical protein
LDRRSIVHVVSRGRLGIARALSRQLEAEAIVRLCDTLPAMSTVHADDIVVAVLADFPYERNPDRLGTLLDHPHLWLVVEDGLGYSAFIQFLRCPPAHVISFTPADRENGFPRLVGALSARLQRPSAESISDLVLSKEPVLRAVESLVWAICSQPEEIRRPRDLAIARGLRLATLKEQVAQLGFTRVEHFIVCVRVVAYEQIVTRLGLSRSVARRLVGITDASNHRRELARAQQRSTIAIRRFATFAAMLFLGFLPSIADMCLQSEWPL